MGKVKTIELSKEVSDYIRNQIGFNVEYDYGSDYDGKYLVYNTDQNNEYELRLTYSVSKHFNKERFIIWDKRIHQPLFKSEFCVYDGSFGRYEFTNKEDFYNHIKSDYGKEWFKVITNGVMGSPFTNSKDFISQKITNTKNKISV